MYYNYVGLELLARARAKGLGLGLASEAEFEFETLPPTFSIVADASGARLRCLLELRITLVLSLRNVNTGSVKIRYLEKLISELSGGRSSFVKGMKIFKMTALFKRAPARVQRHVSSGDLQK